LHGKNVRDIIIVHVISGDAHTNRHGKCKVILGPAPLLNITYYAFDHYPLKLPITPHIFPYCAPIMLISSCQYCLR